MNSLWLAQIGVSPAGPAILVLVIVLFTLFLGALLLAVILIRTMRLVPRQHRLQDSSDPSAGYSELTVKAYDALTQRKIKGIFNVREAVFQIEQGIVCVPDQDGQDPDCDHVVVMSGRQVIGTARLQTLSAMGPIKVGRLAVLESHRHLGVGRAMMHRINREIEARGVDGVMHAQAYLENWYESLGWRRVGGLFVEAGIDHIEMRYSPKNRD